MSLRELIYSIICTKILAPLILHSLFSTHWFAPTGYLLPHRLFVPLGALHIWINTHHCFTPKLDGTHKCAPIFLLYDLVIASTDWAEIFRKDPTKTLIGKVLLHKTSFISILVAISLAIHWSILQSHLRLGYDVEVITKLTQTPTGKNQKLAKHCETQKWCHRSKNVSKIFKIFLMKH